MGKYYDINGQEITEAECNTLKASGKRFKNRELQIMKQLSHPHVVGLKHCFYSNGEKPDELYLNLVLEFVPDTVYRVARAFHKKKEYMPILYVKLYAYQLCRSLAYIHGLGICHRDIKPQSIN